MLIFCSKKLESFFGKSVTPVTPDPDQSMLGDWNAHLFFVERKKCILFMNNKTCYSILMTNILKKDFVNLTAVFKERFIKQLDHDLRISEKTEIKIRSEIPEILLAKSNNDKKIIGTINSHIEVIKYKIYRDGGLVFWDDIRENGHLNKRLSGTKLPIKTKVSRDYFVPVDAMKDLIDG
jgi:hypothetical protein